ncbi:uncharacterized protein LOC118192820 isoform X2 [Stegodyphus dumicola]|uniref:uncharacterized protein LOC118192820 isoform X2 n=1 Tax=Stegodyphus dumicola TaxID=202533 RepID=UPI0015AA8BB8|nr:uncharacterized protein LOC118192820 isoform X2 [Stegodyphus dumicola]
MAESLPTAEKSSREQKYSSEVAKSVNESSINIGSESEIFTEERLKRFSLFQESYPEIHRKCPEELHYIYNKFISEFKSGVQDDLSLLFENTNIRDLLIDLENMIQKQANNVNGPSWRPSGNLEEDLRDHICYEKKKHKEAMQCYLSKMLAQKEAFEEELSQNDKEIRSLLGTIRAQHQKVKEAMGTLDSSMLSKIQDHVMGKSAAEKRFFSDCEF